MFVSEELYHRLFYEIVGKRAIKRAMHLLEKMDRTEQQLRKKLLEGGYPNELVEESFFISDMYKINASFSSKETCAFPLP